MPLASDPVVNIFTVDLEEWFHICGVGGPLGRAHWDRLPSRVEATTYALLEILDRAAVRATWFAVGWVAERHPQLIDEIQKAGHDVGCHGYAHERAYDLGAAAFRSDVRAAVSVLASLGVPSVRYFRAPEWSVNERAPWGLQALVEEGFTHDASMAPLRLVGDPAYPRGPHIRHTSAGPIVEVPPLVADRFGHVMPIGWGWGLRMSSPARVLRTIDIANRAGLPAVLTVHPWELDPDPPKVRLPARLWFAHYFRLDGFSDRLRQILKGVPFGSIREVQPAATPV